jgi:GH25 family lysozyme M1 (1,4-beta-N-acetylmuramidase)
MIYANGTFIQRLEDAGANDLAHYPLWLAKWGPKLGPVPIEKRIWNGKWKFWQFTSDGKLAGFTTSRTDLNVFNGTLKEFQAFANH